MKGLGIALRNSSTKLSREAQARFDRLVLTSGVSGVMRTLGVSRPLVEKLENGGSALAESVAKVEEALRKVGAA